MYSEIGEKMDKKSDDRKDNEISTIEELNSSVNEWIMPYLKAVFTEEQSKDLSVAAANYSLFAGGKRIRPCMMFVTARMLGADLDKTAAFATSLEMIHTYSLIHDDLPAMDNDDLRRGKPTCHIAFGEAIALLAGDLLLNRAYENLFKVVMENPGLSYAAYRLCDRSGINGMVGGQSIDLDSINKTISVDRLYELHAKKTGALIESAICTPYFIKNQGLTAQNAEIGSLITLLKKLAGNIGLAFQIKDDLLDVISTPSELGKSVGKDERDSKSTFVTSLGISGATDRLNREIRHAYSNLEQIKALGFDISEYNLLIDFIATRSM